MIRQIFAQPLIPSEIDLLQPRGMSFVTATNVDQSDDAQIDIRQMRIGAEIIPHDHDSFRFQLDQSLFRLVLANM
jgi:hypothetical protein